MVLSNFLANLLIPQPMMAFLLVHLNVLPSTLLEGRFHGVPLQDHLWSCATCETETDGHVLPHCPFDSYLRHIVITPILQNLVGILKEWYTSFHLMDSGTETSELPNSVQLPESTEVVIKPTARSHMIYSLHFYTFQNTFSDSMRH